MITSPDTFSLYTKMDPFKSERGARDLNPHEIEQAAQEQLEENQQNGIEASVPDQPEAPQNPKGQGDIGAEEESNLDKLDELFVSARDWVDNTFQGDSKSREEFASDASKRKQEREEERTGNIYQVLDETTNAITGGITGAVEGVLEAGELVGDVGNSLISLTSEYTGLEVADKDILWSGEYEAADWDLSLAENKTAVGNFARKSISILLQMKMLGVGKLGKLTSVGKGTTVGSRLATEAVRGAVIDFMESPDEGNLSNLLQDNGIAVPYLTKALAHQDEDNQWMRRLKNMVEGGIIGVAADGVLELFGKLHHGLHTKGTPQEKAQAAFDYNPAKDPGADVRLAENQKNSARPPSEAEPAGRPGDFEPNERSISTSKHDPTDAAESLVKRSKDPLMPGGAKKALDASDYQKMKTEEGLRAVLKDLEERVDVDEIAKRLTLMPEEVRADAYKSLIDFYSDGTIDGVKALERLVTLDASGFKSARANGVVAIDTAVQSTSMELMDLAEAIVDLDTINADFANQAVALVRRSQALTKLKKEVSTQSAFNLMDHYRKRSIPDQRDSLQKSLSEIDERFRLIERAYESGDVEAIASVKPDLINLSRGLLFSGGDATAITRFWSAISKVGMNNINKAVINVWLANPLTQARNLAGNLFVSIERPLATAVGYALPYAKGGAKLDEARRALTMYDASLRSTFEALNVGRKSLMSPAPITSPHTKIIDYSLQTRLELDNLARGAEGWAQQAAVNTLKWHNNLVNSPWVTWPGRALQAGDDIFKTVIARQDLRFGAAQKADLEARVFADVPEFSKGKTPRTADEIYKEMLDESIGPDGEILDHQLLKSAIEGTFQTPLEGMMKEFADTINKFPIARQFVPFTQTPHNVNVYAVQHIPYLSRFTDEWKHTMEFGTPQEQAILRGREALGTVYIIAGGWAVANSGLTGNGPADPEARRLWRQQYEPMSIRNPITGDWVSYKSVPGLDLLLPLVADTAVLSGLMANGEGDKLWTQLMYTIAQGLTNRTYFQGFQEMATMFDPQSWAKEDVAAGLAERGVEALFPLLPKGTMRAIANALKPGLQEYRNSLEEIKGKLTGGLFGDKVAVYDIFTGKQMVNGHEGWWNAINPFRVVGKEVSPVVQALADAGYELPSNIVEKIDGITLTKEEQQLIRKYMYADGELPRALLRYLNSEKYRGRRAHWEQTRGESGVPKEQSEWYRDISELIQGFKEHAKSKLRKDPSEVGRGFRERMNTAETSKALAFQVNGEVDGVKLLQPGANIPEPTSEQKRAAELIKFAGSGGAFGPKPMSIEDLGIG